MEHTAIVPEDTPSEVTRSSEDLKEQMLGYAIIIRNECYIEIDKILQARDSRNEELDEKCILTLEYVNRVKYLLFVIVNFTIPKKYRQHDWFLGKDFHYDPEICPLEKNFIPWCKNISTLRHIRIRLFDYEKKCNKIIQDRTNVREKKEAYKFMIASKEDFESFFKNEAEVFMCLLRKMSRTNLKRSQEFMDKTSVFQRRLAHFAYVPRSNHPKECQSWVDAVDEVRDKLRIATSPKMRNAFQTNRDTHLRTTNRMNEILQSYRKRISIELEIYRKRMEDKWHQMEDENRRRTANKCRHIMLSLADILQYNIFKELSNDLVLEEA